MIITISGKAGSGKSTVAKILSEKLNLKRYSIGDLMRAMAEGRGISLLELNRLAEKDKSIDLELDGRLKELGSTKDAFIVDGRLTAFFVPGADLRIFLTADDKVRAKRILNDEKHPERGRTLKETLDKIKAREESEKKRYMEYYGVDYTDRKLYNQIIDSTHKAAGGVAEIIIKEVNLLKQIKN